ncbi:MAG: hypothetical protein ACR2GQ_09925 [Gemmatimonadota bacterium]
MATLVAREFPARGVDLHSFFVGLVAIHELVGPVAAKWTLDRSGETNWVAASAEGGGLV